MEDIVEWMKEDIDEPECGQCKGMLKPDAVFFGNIYLLRCWRNQRAAPRVAIYVSCRAVYPAALIPRYAQQGCAKLVIINMGPTEMDSMADIRIEAKTGEATPKIIARAKEKM